MTTPPTPPTCDEVRLPARFDAHELGWFSHQLATCGPAVLLDLGGVEFIDTAGLRALVEARARALAIGGDVSIGECSQTARITLELAGLDDVLPLAAEAA